MIIYLCYSSCRGAASPRGGGALHMTARLRKYALKNMIIFTQNLYFYIYKLDSTGTQISSRSLFRVILLIHVLKTAFFDIQEKIYL